MKKICSILLTLVLTLLTAVPAMAEIPSIRWQFKTYSTYECIHNETKIYKVSVHRSSEPEYGIVDRYGTECLEPVYSEIDFDKNAEIGLVKSSRNDPVTYHLVDKHGRFIETAGYSFGSVMRDGDDKLFVLGKDGTYVIYGENWEKLLECQGIGSAFSENKLAVQNASGKWGYIDSKGKLVIPYILDVSGRFENGVGFPEFAGGDGSAPIINDKGEILHDAGAAIQDAVLEKMEAGYGIYKSGDHYGVIDSAGNGVLPFDYLDISAYPTDGSTEQPYFIAQKKVFSSFPYGVVDSANNTVVPFEYEQVSGLITVGQKTYFVAAGQGGEGIVDSTGRVTVPLEYFGIIEATENPDYTVSVIAWNENYKYGVIDLNNKIITPFQYSGIEGVKGPFKVQDSDGVTIDHYIWEPLIAYDSGIFYDIGYIIETPDARYGLVDNKGNILLPAEYEEIEYDSTTGFAKVQKEKWGIVDYKGRIRVPVLYDELGDFQNGFCEARTEDGKIGFVDENGEPMVLEEDKGFAVATVPFTPSGYGGLNNRIIDSNGDTVFTPPEGYVYQKGYNGQIGIFTDENGKYGCLFSDGSLAIPFLYEDISYCTVYGGISYAAAKSDGTYRIIYQNGEPLFDPRVTYKRFSVAVEGPFFLAGQNYLNNPFSKIESETLAVRPSVCHLGVQPQANMVTVTANVSDPYDTIASVEFKIDGTAVEDSMDYFDTASGEFQYQAELADGEHSVSLIVTNSAGRQSYPDICNFTVCSTEPEIIHSPQAAFQAGDSIAISATADSSVHTVYLYYQDGNNSYQAIPMSREGNTFTCTVDKAFYDLHYYFKAFSPYGVSISDQYTTNSNGTVIEGALASSQLACTEGEIKGDITFSATNNSGSALAVQAIVALYNEMGQLCGLTRKDVELKSGSNEVVLNDLCFPDVPAGIYRAKVFVWNKGGAMLPLTEPIEVPINR